jgi:hypothetical protein
MSQTPGMPGAQHSGSIHTDQIEQAALSAIYNLASIVTLPLEFLLRPQFGSRYCPAPIFFISAVMMVILSAIAALVTTVTQMIPFVHIPLPAGMIGIGTLTWAFLIAGLVHGIRIWKRMVHPEREQHSCYEGPALPFFALLPNGSSFWTTRICWEPVLVLVLSTVLGNLAVLQCSAVLYLRVAAIFLAMKQYVAWYRSWSYIRDLMDMRFAAPQIAKLVDNTATEDDLAQVHLASFPKDLPADIRRQTVAHIARAFSYEAPESGQPEDSSPIPGGA